MAFPTVATTNTSSETSQTTSHDVSLPASITAGDLLMIFFNTQENPTITTPTGWTLLKTLDASGGTARLATFYKTATGSEGATVVITTSTSWRSTHATMRISGWSGTPGVSSGATGDSGQADPDNLTPSGGAKDYLWIAFAGSNNASGGEFTSAPTNYSNFLAQATSGTAVGVASRQLNASSENPGTFGGTLGRWGAATIAISPEAAAGPSNLKSLNTNLKANIKTINTNAIANVKSLNTNT